MSWSAILWGNCNATAAGLNGFCSVEQKIDTFAGSFTYHFLRNLIGWTVTSIG